MDAGSLALDGLLLSTLGAGAVTDVRHGRVYNSLTYSGLVAGVLLNGILHPAGIGFGNALLGVAVTFFPMLVIYLGGGLGGGDVKLMAVVGAFLGPWWGLYALLYTCLAGAVLVVGWILWVEGWTGLVIRLTTLFRPTPPEAREAERRMLRFPFAVAILVGAAWAITERNLGVTLVDALSQGAP